MGNVKTDLVVVQGNLNAQCYVNLLNNNSFMQNFGPGSTFQQDNTRPHAALVTANFLAQHERFTLASFIPGYESYRAHLG